MNEDDDHPALEEISKISGIFWFPVQAAKPVAQAPVEPREKPERMAFEVFIASVIELDYKEETG